MATPPESPTPSPRERASFGELHKLTTPVRGLEADLHLAMEHPADEFVMHYQPVVDLTSGRVVAVESLARWQHPVLGLLAPNRFITLAEDQGLIGPLGDWALGQAIRDASVLTREGRELDMAINFSVHQLDDHVVGKVQDALEANDVRPERLTVEVTESAFLKDEGITAATYAALSSLGVKFAIDDFGTSFSSLLRLRLYPINALKIDRAVVAGIGASADDEAICDSIISLARAVSASTVAEGVETAEQYGVLRSMGCQRGQGWLWSPAVPIDQLEDAIAASERVPVAERQSRLPRVADGVSCDDATLIAEMHAAGSSTQDIAAALNHTVGRHPSGVRWTAGAVARGLPVSTDQRASKTSS
ncbi:EAL domain-containing protein [Nocardioides sp.]|uniref:EAL domain-containing protein n=1 Tax=Nocardioides sp. TaxID=35761 RepID=UPI002CFF7DEB|nr:EAL domain-containing protein [Nocardioides sp.]HXH78951.1 EAL domain-containing protein [Nocardioides sp.]